MSRHERELLPGDLVCVDLTSCHDAWNPLDEDLPGIAVCTPCNAVPATVTLYPGDVLLYLGSQKCCCVGYHSQQHVDVFLSSEGVVAPHRYGTRAGMLHNWMRRI